MTEDELIHLLRELDHPLEPSATFRDDLLARLRTEREHTSPSRVKGRSDHPIRQEPDAPEVWASPARRPRRGKLVWAVAAFVAILAVGALTWWLAPGSTSQPPTATSPTPSSVPETSAPDQSGTSVPAEQRSAEVVEVRSPGSEDYQLLQQSIDDNPGAVLQLQAGTYDLGGNTLTFPHGVTIRGSNRDSNARQTRIKGQIQIVALGPGHSDEEVTLSGIQMEAAESEFVVLYGRHRSGDAPSGGAKLTIEDAFIRADDVFTAVDLHARGIDVTITSSIVVSDQGFAIYAFDRGDSTIEVSDSRIDFANFGIVIAEDDSRPGVTSTVRILDNHLRGGPLPPEEVSSASVAGVGVSSTGDVAIRGNTIEIAYGISDPLDPAVGIGIGDVSGVEVSDNRLVGGDSDEHDALRVGLRVRSRDGAYARNTLEGSWTTGVMVYTPGNTFDDNSLRRVNLTSAEEEPPPESSDTLPAVHWWLGAGASENTITDNTFEKLLIIDRGEENSYPEFFELVEP